MKTQIFSILMTAVFAAPVMAEDDEPPSQGDARCETAYEEAWDELDSKQDGNLHGARGFFLSVYYQAVRVIPADPENVLCHFKYSMEIDPISVGTFTKTFGEQTMNVVIEDATAADNEWEQAYTYKGTVYVDTVTDANKYMVIWWGGTASASKGYMITGPQAMDGGNNVFVSYIQWDLTDASAQFFKTLATHFDKSAGYLQTPGSNSQEGGWGDMATYSEVLYNADEDDDNYNEVTVQVTNIENQRAENSGSGNFGCFKMKAKGTKGGEMLIAKTEDSLSATGHSLSSTDTDSTEMDAAHIADATTTPNLVGNIFENSSGNCAGRVPDDLDNYQGACYHNGTDGLQQGTVVGSDLPTFGKSCNDLNSAGDSGGAFEDGTVDFDAAPTSIFGS